MLLFDDVELDGGMPDVEAFGCEHDSDKHCPPWKLLPNDVWTYIIEQLEFFDKLLRSRNACVHGCMDGPSCLILFILLICIVASIVSVKVDTSSCGRQRIPGSITFGHQEDAVLSEVVPDS